MSVKSVIKSTNVLLPGSKALQPASIVIEDGKILNVGKYEESFARTSVVDYGELTITSGIVDTHAHINEPGRTEWEGFVTATRASAAGGITTVIDMPLNSIPATVSVAAMEQKMDSARGHCTIDYGFWGGIIPGNENEIEPMIRRGIMGFKCFLCPSGVDEFPHVTSEDLEKVMPILARYNVPLLVHAEIEGPCGASELSPQDYDYYLASRPPEWEVNAIQMVIALARRFKCRTHIVHLSAAEALKDIVKAQSEGVLITAETCPHYLVFESEEIRKGATHFKCAPPIRGHYNRELLWQGVKNGSFEFIVSDHSPCTPHLKHLQLGDFGKAWGGIAGLQFSMNSIWTEMKKREMGIFDLSHLMSYRTARFLNLEKKKGQIQIGCDADFVIWDPTQEFVVQEKDIHHRHKVTPYLGMKLLGKIQATILRGELVFQDGIFNSKCLGREVLRREEA